MTVALGVQHNFYSLKRASGRVLFGFLVGAIVLVVVAYFRGFAVGSVAAWDATAFALLGVAWSMILRAGPEQTRRYAAAEDPGRSAVFVIVVAASAVSLFSTAVLLRQARAASPGDSTILCTLAVGAVVLSWVLTHTVYTLRYAHLYYRTTHCEDEGGLEFPGVGKPAEIDFAYFSFTVGMCFQVSDVTISSRRIRRATLFHACLSFAYNSVILAFMLNLMFGLFN